MCNHNKQPGKLFFLRFHLFPVRTLRSRIEGEKREIRYHRVKAQRTLILSVLLQTEEMLLPKCIALLRNERLSSSIPDQHPRFVQEACASAQPAASAGTQPSLGLAHPAERPLLLGLNPAVLSQITASKRFSQLMLCPSSALTELELTVFYLTTL